MIFEVSWVSVAISHTDSRNYDVCNPKGDSGKTWAASEQLLSLARRVMYTASSTWVPISRSKESLPPFILNPRNHGGCREWNHKFETRVWDVFNNRGSGIRPASWWKILAFRTRPSSENSLRCASKVVWFRCAARSSITWVWNLHWTVDHSDIDEWNLSLSARHCPHLSPRAGIQSLDELLASTWDTLQKLGGSRDPAFLDQHGHPLSRAVERIGCQHCVSGILRIATRQLGTGWTMQIWFIARVVKRGKVENVENHHFITLQTSISSWFSHWNLHF